MSNGFSGDVIVSYVDFSKGPYSPYITHMADWFVVSVDADFLVGRRDGYCSEGHSEVQNRFGWYFGIIVSNFQVRTNKPTIVILITAYKTPGDSGVR